MSFEVIVADRRTNNNVTMPLRIGTRTDINEFLEAAAVRELLSDTDINNILNHDFTISRQNHHRRFDIKKHEDIKCSDPKIGAMFR